MRRVPDDLLAQTSELLSGAVHKIVNTDSEIAVVPREYRAIHGVAEAAVIEAVLLVAAGVLIHYGETLVAIGVAAFGMLTGAGTVLVGLWGARQAHRRGPWMRYLKKERRLLVPRSGTTAGLDEVQHLRLVIGGSVGWRGCIRAELQLVLRVSGGAGTRVVPIIEGLHRGQLRQILDAVPVPAFKVSHWWFGRPRVTDLRTGARVNADDYLRDTRPARVETISGTAPAPGMRN